MKNRNVIRIMCVLLLVMLLCAFGPAAWADEGSGAQQTPDAAAPAATREQLLLDYMACVMVADKAQSQAEQEQMLLTAEGLWQNYCDMLRGQWKTAEPEPAPAAEPAPVEAAPAEPAASEIEQMRTELLSYYLLYVDAANTEQDPYVRRQLFADADAIWDAYMSLLIEDQPTAKAAEQPVEAAPAAEQSVEAAPAAEQPVEAAPAAEQAVEAAPVAEQPVEAAPAAGQPADKDKLADMRAELLTYYLLCMDAANKEQDPYARAELIADAGDIWDAYMYLVREEKTIQAGLEAEAEAEAMAEAEAIAEAEAMVEAAQPQVPYMADEIAALREELLTYYLLYMDAANAQQDPYVRDALYDYADSLWMAYMDLVLGDETPEYPMEEDIYLDSYALDDPYLMDPYEDEMSDWAAYSHGGKGHHHKPADTKPAEAVQPEAQSEPLVGLPNPWTETDSLEEAAQISGVALDPPVIEALPNKLQLQHFRAMDGTIEADYANGEDTMMIRASLKEEGMALSGDYNSYSKQWKENIKGLSVRCLGDGEKINVATFRRGELAFAINADPGITAGELKSIVLGMQAKPYTGSNAGIIGGADEATEIIVTAPESTEPAADSEIVVNYTFTHSDENGTTEESGSFTLPTEPAQEASEPAAAVEPAEPAAPAAEPTEPAAPVAEAAEPAAEPAEQPAEAAEPAESAVVTSTDYTLVIHDPSAVDAEGKPVRLVRTCETNLGDLCADAFRAQARADIGLIDSGAICADLGTGDITDAGIRAVLPYGDNLCLIAASGQQILDALEWGSRAVPYEFGGFLQTSGLSYEIHSYIESGCIVDENGLFAGVDGERRVKNVMVGGEALDPERVYLVAGPDFLLLNNGGGNTAFRGAIVLRDQIKPDTQTLIDYLIDNLGGVIGEQYADPYGVGRIVVYEVAPTQGEQAPAAAADAPAQLHTDVKKAPDTAKHPKIMIKAA